jgi:methylthioribose-1-phosphate isomerase
MPPVRPLKPLRLPATVRWIGGIDGRLRLLDQTRLPGQAVFVDCRTLEQVVEAIKMLRVRGAPAIGVTAAYGLVIGWAGNRRRFRFMSLHEVGDVLIAARPTAVNLAWAVRRGIRAAYRRPWNPRRPDREQFVLRRLLTEARAVHREDAAMCAAIGRHGAKLLADGAGVLTHCNAGALATAGMGTALAAIYTAHAAGKRLRVFVDETRPLLQGARLTAWELSRAGVEVTLICDGMAARVMAEGRIDAVIVGADRIAANGDTANKIGTYSAALAAEAHGIPFYVAAPSSTFDLSLPDGSRIPIEQRAAAEVTDGFGRPTAPPGTAVYNPAFDVTPARLITAIITDRGIIRPVTPAGIRRTCAGAGR